MDTWILEKTGYDPETVLSDGNRFLLANGYMGLRGTVEEADRTACPAVNLAGVYDRFEDRWREPVNAPWGLSCRLRLNGENLALGNAEAMEHRQKIDYRHGVFSRMTDFGTVKLTGERIVSLAEPHLMAARLIFHFESEGEAELRIGISTEIWDINGPHLFDFRFETGERLLCTARTGEKSIPLAVSQSMCCDFQVRESFETGEEGVFRRLAFPVKKGQTCALSLFAAVFTGLDGENPASAASLLSESARRLGYVACREENNRAWERVWARSAIELEGDDEAALALHASQYYLNSIAPRHADALSIPARGLSGQTYKGAVFWDSEIFFFPMFVHTQPEIARSLLRYRIETLPGALEKAREYGFRGAFYAWESQEGGREGCTNFNVVDVFTHRPVRTWFRDKQIHISADIAYAMRRYYEITGDRSLLEEGGAEVILQCARFYLSRATRHLDRKEVDLADVIGPDEYHERVTNSAFTNRMAAYCVESALRLEEVFSDRREWLHDLYEKLDYWMDLSKLRELRSRIRGVRTRDGVIEQFDGYFDLEDCSLETVRSRLRDPREYWGGDHGVAGQTQIIKQADVIALMALLPEQFDLESVAANWDYYEPRTEHGSSLSACMYALTACRIGKPERAWELFLKTASIDLEGGGKQWAGEIYIGGTHPAANGGAWMIAALGFAGLRVQNGKLELHPRLPRQIRRLRFPISLGGKQLLLTVTREGWTAEKLEA